MYDDPDPTTKHLYDTSQSHSNNHVENEDGNDGNDENIFFMANNNSRHGNGHVTPEDLKNKLLEYKNQLDAVKNIFQTRENNNNNSSKNSNCIVGEVESESDEVPRNNRPSLSRFYGNDREDCSLLSPEDFPHNINTDYENDRDNAIVEYNKGYDSSSILSPQKHENTAINFEDRNKICVYESPLLMPENTVCNINENIENTDNENADEMRIFLPIESSDNEEQDYYVMHNSQGEVENVKNNNIRTIKRINRTTKPSRLRTPTPVFRKSSHENVDSNKTSTGNIPKKHTIQKEAVASRSKRSTTSTIQTQNTSKMNTTTTNRLSKTIAKGVPRKSKTESSCESSPRRQPTATTTTTTNKSSALSSAFSVNVRNKDKSAGGFSVKRPSSVRTKTASTLNPQDTQKMAAQQQKHRKSAQQLNKESSTPDRQRIFINNNNIRSSNPIPIRRPTKLKYERSDSELSSCSNASSYFTDGRGCGAFNSDVDSKPRTSRLTKQRNQVSRSRSSIESREMKEMYELKYKELRNDMEKKLELHDLSSSLKEQYLDSQRNELESKCNRYEQHIDDLEKKSRDHSTKSNEYELKYTKLEFQNSLICNEYNRLKNEKSEIEHELVRCQEMLNQSYTVQKEVEKCLENVKNNEVILASKLKEVQTENEGLKNDLETLKSLCMENDERVKYYQQMESRLQECMTGAMLQIANLEKETIQANVHHKLELQKLMDQHSNLRREHDAIKILYSDALRKIEESSNDKDDLRRAIHQIQVQAQSRDLIYNLSNHSSRNHSPLTQTPVGSPNTVRKLAKRRAWFPPEVSFDKFKPKNNNDDDVIMSHENSQNSSPENEAFNNSKVCDILIEHSSPRGQDNRNKIPDNRNIRGNTHNNHRHRRQQSLNSSYNGESDSTSYDSDACYCHSRSTSISSSLRSSTSNLLLTPDYDTPSNPFVFGASQLQQQQQQQQQIATSESWYISVSSNDIASVKKPPTDHVGNKYQKANEVDDKNKEGYHDTERKKGSVGSNKNEKVTSSSSSSSSRRIGRFNALRKPTTTTADTTSRPSSAASSISSTATKSSLPKPVSYKRPSSAIPTPCGVSKTYLTTEEVLAKVQEKPIQRKTFFPESKESKSSKELRFEQLCTYRSEEEAKEIVELEERLQQLNGEKSRLNTQLGKIPTRSSLRSTSRSAQQEVRLEAQADEIAKELAGIRSALKRLNAF